MNDPQSIRDWVLAAEPSIVALLADLVRIDSTTGREGELAEFCARWLTERGIEAILHPCQGRHNALGVVGRGDDALVLSGHLDTVPADREVWSRDPHEPVVQDGKVYGLGTSDLKASIAGAYFAQLWLHEAGLELPGRVVSAFTIEEETTGIGTQEMLRWALDDGFLVPHRTVAVITEPTGLDELCTGNSGCLFASIGVTGLGGHGSRPHLARNPIPKLLAIVDGLGELAATWAEQYSDLDLAPPTLTPTVVRAGEVGRNNVIPDQASAVIDCRVPEALYAEDFAEFRRELDRWLDEFREDGYTLSWRVIVRREGQRIDPEHPIVQTALTTLASMGRSVDVRTTTAGNDAVFFGQVGIPAINKIGPGHPECAHRTDEFVRVENVLAGTEFFIRLALSWAERLDSTRS